MRSLMHILLAWLPVVMDCCACAPTANRVTREPVTLGGAPRYGWYQVYDGMPTHIVIAKLTIPDLLDEKVYEIPVARYVRLDAEGLLHLAPEMHSRCECADGANEKGGFGYVGSISVWDDESDDDALILRVYYFWTTPNQVRGELSQEVPVKVGSAADVQLPAGCRLQVAWRPAQPSTMP